MLRIVIIHGDDAAPVVHWRWLDAQAARRHAGRKIEKESARSAKSPV